MTSNKQLSAKQAFCLGRAYELTFDQDYDAVLIYLGKEEILTEDAEQVQFFNIFNQLRDEIEDILKIHSEKPDEYRDATIELIVLTINKFLNDHS